MIEENGTTAYCENCRAERQVHLVSDTETLELEGVSYTYDVLNGYCTSCGGLATPQAVQESNQRAFSDAVRSCHGIVSQQVVEDLTKRYDIRPRPLSALLGWGEHTYSRFMEGDIPSKKLSDTIETLWASPLRYLLVLLNNGDALTPVALRKSTKAAMRFLVEHGSKAERAAAYLIGKTGSNSSLALQKELYYGQGLMLAFHGRPLMPERCEAWRMGPVFPNVWELVRLRDVDEEKLIDSDLDGCVRETFSAEELEVLDAVVAEVALYSPYILRDITHKERPWADARRGLPDNEPSRSVISDGSILSYFDGLRQAYHMSQPRDIKRYMADMVATLGV